MKHTKILFAALLMAFAMVFTNTVKAQNLQYGQAVLLTFAANTSPYASQLYTVPAGKVWKIESGGCNGASVNLYEINGLRVNVYLTSSGTSTAANNVPVWLPAGTTMKFYNNGSSTAGSGCYVSILEFTPTP